MAREYQHGRRSSASPRLGDWLLDDVAVPCSRVTDLIASVEKIAAEHTVTIGVFSHACDGNLHPTIICDSPNPGQPSATLAAVKAITPACCNLAGPPPANTVSGGSNGRLALRRA